MTKIVVNPYWQNADVSDYDLNWYQDQDGVDRRQSCDCRAGVITAYAANHLLAKHVRTLLTLGFPLWDTDGNPAWLTASNTAQDVIDLLWNRSYATGRGLRILAISAGRDGSANIQANTFLEFQHASTFGGAADGTANTSWDNRDINVFTTPYTRSVSCDLGEPTNAIHYGKVVAHGGQRWTDIVIQEASLKELDTDLNHVVADPPKMAPLSFVTDNQAERVRAAVHHLRSMGLPVLFAWSAIGGPDNPDFSSPGSIRGMTVESGVDGTDFVNLLDHSISERNADTPGVTGYASYAAFGLNTAIPISFHVLGERNDSTGDAQVRFETTWGNAIVDVTYNGTGSNGWVSVSAGLMNSTIANDDSGNRNKIDIYGKVDQGALTIYAIVGLIKYQ